MRDGWSVMHGDIRVKFSAGDDRLLAVCKLTQKIEIGFGLEEGGQAVANDSVVVSDDKGSPTHEAGCCTQRFVDMGRNV